MKNITIYLADDHPIVVEGLREILKAQDNIIVKNVAHNGKQLIELLSKELVDLVITDISMPELDGIECTKWIKLNTPDVKVIVLTMYPEKTFISKIIDAGADGCLLKSRGSIDLLSSIERVMQGKSYFDYVSDFKKQSIFEKPLSKREIEIIKLIVRGKTSTQIASELFISRETVKTHRKNIFQKLDIKSSAQLITYSINNGII